MTTDRLALYNLLVPRSGRTRQLSSFGRDPDRGGTWFGLRPAAARQKRIALAPGETHVLGAPSGAGVITRLWMTTMLPLQRRALRDVVLRFYWDREQHPSVECPFGDFFGAPFGHYATYSSEPMTVASGGFTCQWPMPYVSGARLEMTNEGTATIDPIFYQVTFDELDAPLETDLRFHAHWRRENPTQPGVPYTLLETRGQGHFVGCHVAMQNREWWLRPPLGDIIFPHGFGLGMLEGPECIWVDGEETPSVQGTGTEDYFNAGWYFAGGRFSAPYHGCTVRDYLRARAAAYRFDVTAPVPFRRSIRVALDHGWKNLLAGDYSSVAYWYQTEPHPPFPALPNAAARTPTSPLLNVLQVALALGTPVLLGVALAQGRGWYRRLVPG